MALELGGHQVLRLTRGLGTGCWDPMAGTIDREIFGGVDAVVHLAGETIGGRWTLAKKQAIRESRIRGTSLLASCLVGTEVEVFVSGSAIGYYGDRGDELLTESSLPGDGFLAALVEEWEQATAPASQAAIRTVTARTSLVLDTDGGSLPRMLLPFRLGLGGPIGSGDQWWSWITLQDEVRAIIHCLETPTLSGPVNLCAPASSRNRSFTKTLAAALHRPAILAAPAFGLRLALGTEFADEVLLASQNVSPARLIESGFKWVHPTLGEALDALLGRQPT